MGLNYLNDHRVDQIEQGVRWLNCECYEENTLKISKK